MYIFFILFASFLYAIQVNLLKVYLQNVSAVAIAVGNFVFILPFSIVIFLFTDYKQIDLENQNSTVHLLGGHVQNHLDEKSLNANKGNNNGEENC